ncbi:folylpolyglutamate synthase/dihydrofolate synthase family protein [soil metagenome]
MNFQESNDYLLSLGNEVSAMKLGLENIRKLLAQLGNPQNNYLKVQVAGTNGKGSVCAFLNSICVTAGIRTGMYTSPHLISITERIQIDGLEIDEDDFAELATRVRETCERLAVDGDIDNIPTFFEQVTAIALVAFADANAEMAILETGLGGRLDATTAANAEIAAITEIDLDHQNYLGETLAEIAAEKAAIIHEGSRVVAARQNKAVERVIAGRCAEFGIVPVWSTTEIATNTWEHIDYLAHTHSFRTERGYYHGIDPLMLGRHQARNAAVALGVAEILDEEYFDISQIEICLGLETAVHPGRLEFVDGILLDGAHTESGARALKEFLDESIKRPIVIVFGAMQDKNVSEIASILSPGAAKLILTRPDNSRAMSATEVAEQLPTTLDRSRVILTSNVREAIQKAREVSSGDHLILVTGSLYLVGEVKRLLRPV